MNLLQRTFIYREHIHKLIACLSMAGLFLAGCNLAPAAPAQSTGPGQSPSATQFVFPPTYTPTLPGPATETPTPRPSRTPAPTATAAPTLFPSATPLFEIKQANEENLLPITANLLYFSGEEVRILEQINLEDRPLDADNIPDALLFADFSNNGAFIAVGQETEEGVRILVYDRFNAAVNSDVRLEAVTIHDLSISPDGSGLVAVLSEAESQNNDLQPTSTPETTATPENDSEEELPTPTAVPTEVLSADINLTYSIYYLDLSENDGFSKIAVCGEVCSSVLWRPQSDFFVWGDSDGLWLLDDELLQPKIILTPFLVGATASGEQSDSYLPLSFSPSGQYLMVRKGLEVGSILSVVDLDNRIVENIPGTGEYTGANTGFSWQIGDGLMIARPGIARLELTPAIELWNLNSSAQGVVFEINRVFEISDNYDVSINNPIFLFDGRISFVMRNLRNPAEPSENGLYLLDPISGFFEQVNYLPITQVEDISWLPDVSGAFLRSEKRLLYVPAGFGQILSLSSLVERSGCCYTWVP